MPGVLFTICRTTAAPWKPAPITATLMGRPSASSRASALSTIIIGSVPNLPGWIGEPMLLQYHSVPQGIHALPKSVMTMAGELARSEEHTSELQSLMRISYAVFCLKKKIEQKQN